MEEAACSECEVDFEQCFRKPTHFWAQSISGCHSPVLSSHAPKAPNPGECSTGLCRRPEGPQHRLQVLPRLSTKPQSCACGACQALSIAALVSCAGSHQSWPYSFILEIRFFYRQPTCRHLPCCLWLYALDKTPLHWVIQCHPDSQNPV